MEEAERSHILQILEQTGGIVGGPNGAAARLGPPRTTLISKMRRLACIADEEVQMGSPAPSAQGGELGRSKPFFQLSPTDRTSGLPIEQAA